MRRSKGILGAAVLAVGLAGASARADVIFDLRTTAAAPPGALSISGQVVVTDAAAAGGFSFLLSNLGGTNAQYPMPMPSLAGLIGLSLSVETDGGDLTAGLGDFFRQTGPGSGHNYRFSLTGSSAAGLSGSLYFNNSESELSLSLFGATGNGGFNTDAGGSCGRTGACTFTAAVAQSVPEPAGLALFGAGLLGLGMARRPKARAGA